MIWPVNVEPILFLTKTIKWCLKKKPLRKDAVCAASDRGLPRLAVERWHQMESYKKNCKYEHQGLISVIMFFASR